jgi:hypothetical protein
MICSTVTRDILACDEKPKGPEEIMAGLSKVSQEMSGIHEEPPL